MHVFKYNHTSACTHTVGHVFFVSWGNRVYIDIDTFPIRRKKTNNHKNVVSVFPARTCPVPYTHVPLWSREPSQQPPLPPEHARWRTCRLYRLQGYQFQTAALPAQTGHLKIERHINSKYHVPPLLKCKKHACRSVRWRTQTAERVNVYCILTLSEADVDTLAW